jgi:hypothetical protein
MTEKWMRRSEAASEIVKRKKTDADTTLFGPFVEGPYFDFYGRKWKESTAYMNQQRVRMHLVEPFRYRELSSFKRDELQDLPDAKAGMSFSVVDHLRWDLKQIFDMAIAEGHIRLNPAALLFTPKDAKGPKHPAMAVEQTAVRWAL